jgi:hypothetical protein
MKNQNPWRYKRQLYNVDVTIWEGGCGRGHMDVLCKTLKDACLVKQALEKVFPKHIESHCGDSDISRSVKIEVHPAHVTDVEEFVTTDEVIE